MANRAGSIEAQIGQIAGTPSQSCSAFAHRLSDKPAGVQSRWVDMDGRRPHVEDHGLPGQIVLVFQDELVIGNLVPEQDVAYPSSTDRDPARGIEVALQLGQAPQLVHPTRGVGQDTGDGG